MKQKLGGRLRVGVSGAAPLGINVLEFFHSLGMLVIEGYGLTETASSLTVNDPDDFRFGTVGRAVEGTEIRLDEDGEILVRSDTVFAGYYKDPEATAAAFTDDGWFRTGDVGEIDADGFLKITDRKKDLIITAGGKNIAPQNLENALKTSRYVSQALIVGDRRPYITALITLDPAEVDASGRDPHELVQEDRRRGEPRPRARRADQALRHPSPRLHAGGRRGHADAQASPQDRPRALRGQIEELYSLSAWFSDRIRVPRERGRVRRGADDRAGGRRLARLALGARRASAAATLVLAVIVAALGPALTRIPISALRLIVGALLLTFGLQWLRKAILRASGFKALHDEEAIFARELEEARAAGSEQRAGHRLVRLHARVQGRAARGPRGRVHRGHVRQHAGEHRPGRARRRGGARARRWSSACSSARRSRACRRTR